MPQSIRDVAESVFNDHRDEVCAAVEALSGPFTVTYGFNRRGTRISMYVQAKGCTVVVKYPMNGSDEIISRIILTALFQATGTQQIEKDFLWKSSIKYYMSFILLDVWSKWLKLNERCHIIDVIWHHIHGMDQNIIFKGIRESHLRELSERALIKQVKHARKIGMSFLTISKIVRSVETEEVAKEVLEL
jgi:hypothetical protein